MIELRASTEAERTAVEIAGRLVTVLAADAGRHGVDEHDAAAPPLAGKDALMPLFGEAQAAKSFVNATATRVVDPALAPSGGAGYLSGSVLARAYRDVRAGAFMPPRGANRAFDVLADVALQREPALR